jgi:predicted NBD/HSP70 family sugar kinase
MVFDIGGTFVKYAILDRSGNIFIQGKFPTPQQSLDELLLEMFSTIERYEEYEVKGISICCPGVVDSYQGVVYYGGCLTYLHEVNLKQKFIEKFKLPVSIENGGIVIDGKLHRGQHFSAGEVSYMVGDPTDQPGIFKMCGFDACAPKMINDIAEANGLSPDTDGRIVFEYIKKENAASWSIFTEYCHKIAKMIVSLQYILDPERFIICGGISTQSLVCEQIMKEVEQIYKKNPMYLLMPVIENSTLNNDANLYGALYHFFEEYIEKADEYAEHNAILCPNCSTELIQSEQKAV